jgi:hypothetical protein
MSTASGAQDSQAGFEILSLKNNREKGSELLKQQF